MLTGLEQWDNAGAAENNLWMNTRKEVKILHPARVVKMLALQVFQGNGLLLLTSSVVVVEKFQSVDHMHCWTRNCQQDFLFSIISRNICVI
jgi:hypothetical protein